MAKLRMEWLAAAGFGVAFLAIGYLVLHSAGQNAGAWLMLSSPALIYLFAVAWINLKANHRRDETALLVNLGWGNRLTLLRGILIAGVLGFLALPQLHGWLAWIPGVLYTLSIGIDFFDGYAARITNHATRLGEILDMSFDGLGVLIAAVLAVYYGKAPTWFLVIGLARYLFLIGIWLRKRAGRPVYDLKPSINRRLFAGLQMGFLAGALLPIFTPPGTHIAAVLFSIPMAAGFIRDWLHVSGVTAANAPGRSDRIVRVYRWVAVGMRVFILLLNFLIAWNWLQKTPEPFTEMYLLISLNLVVVLLTLMGILPRIAAIAGLCLLGVYQLIHPLTPLHITLAVFYTVILYQGSGAFSIWTPEEVLFRQTIGKARTVELGQAA